MIQSALAQTRGLPVKLFINCCNSRRVGKVEEPLPHLEVTNIGRRDIEGFALLLNEFLPQMRGHSLNPAVINVNNDVQSQDGGHVFYLSTQRFKETLTSLLGTNFKEVNTISVKVNFKKLGEDPGSLSKKLVPKTFSYLGIKPAIEIN